MQKNKHNEKKMKDLTRRRLIAGASMLFMLFVISLNAFMLLSPSEDTFCEIIAATPEDRTTAMFKTGEFGVAVPRDALTVTAWAAPVDNYMRAGVSVTPVEMTVNSTGNDTADAGALVGQRMPCVIRGVFGDVALLNRKSGEKTDPNALALNLLLLYLIMGLSVGTMGVMYITALILEMVKSCRGNEKNTSNYFWSIIEFSFIFMLLVIELTTMVGSDESCNIVTARASATSPHGVSVWAANHYNTGARFDFFLGSAEDVEVLIDTLNMPGAKVPCGCIGWGNVPTRLFESGGALPTVKSQNGESVFFVLCVRAALVFAGLLVNVIAYSDIRKPRVKADEYSPPRELAS